MRPPTSQSPYTDPPYPRNSLFKSSSLTAAAAAVASPRGWGIYVTAL